MTATRFLRRGVTKVRFAPSLASALAVTTTEWSSAVDLTPQIADFSGWTYSNAAIATPDLTDTFDSTIPGVDTVDASTLTFYDLKEDPDPIKVSQAKGTTGYILIAPKGSASGKPLQIWPVVVASRADQESMGADPARYVATYAPSARPKEDAVVP